MKQTLTAEQWVDNNVNVEKLQRDVVKALREAIIQGWTDEYTYTALVYDIVNGHHGIYIPAFALQFFEYEGIDTDDMDNIEGVEYIHDELEYYAGEVASVINRLLPNEVNVSFGYWDSDGTYCLMAHLDEVELENYKDESHNFISEAFGDLAEQMA